MNAKTLADMLNGREIGDEITKAEEKLAKDAGLVVLFGYSDDNAEFRGAINDEVGCYDGGDLFATRSGVLEEHEDCECKYCGFASQKKKAVKIEAIWCDKQANCSWSYQTSIPHETFTIKEDDETFCIGIVFSITDLPE